MHISLRIEDRIVSARPVAYFATIEDPVCVDLIMATESRQDFPRLSVDTQEVRDKKDVSTWFGKSF